MSLIKKLTGLFSNNSPSSQVSPDPLPIPTKVFGIAAEEMKAVALGFGGCIASDMIVVDGHPVRFMYRIEPHNSADSGWAFLSGLESDDYMNDAKNHGIYDINTIANYDPTITSFLDAPAGSAFEKTPESEAFVEVKDWVPSED